MLFDEVSDLMNSVISFAEMVRVLVLCVCVLGACVCALVL